MKEIIEQAHMAGQSDAGVDPSTSSARFYCLSIMQKNTKKVHVVWSNTDLTEGKGKELPIAVCSSITTARKLAVGKGVMGSNATVKTVSAIYVHPHWYAPVSIQSPSREDIDEDNLIVTELERQDRKKVALKKAKEAGLSEEDLKILSD